jgi:carbamoyl-phosphate synthase large subunit
VSVSTRRLLISGIGKRNALLRLLRQECAHYGVEIVGADASMLPPARVDVERFAITPLASSATFKSAYAALLREHTASAHLTLVDPEIPLLGDMENEGLSVDSKLLHPIASTARLCEDKYAFWEFLRQHGLPDIPTFLAPLKQFPFIRKHRSGSAASGFAVFQDSSDLLRHEVENRDPRYIFQPFCRGQHFCIDAYFSLVHGRLVDSCAKEVLDKKNGESFLLRSAPRDRFTDVLVKLGSVLPLRGIVNFDIYVENDDIRIMEINCRIGGNYPASHAFGCNLLKHAMSEILGGVAAESSFSPYVSGSHISKYFEFTHVYEKDAF